MCVRRLDPCRAGGGRGAGRGSNLALGLVAGNLEHVPGCAWSYRRCGAAWPYWASTLGVTSELSSAPGGGGVPGPRGPQQGARWRRASWVSLGRGELEWIWHHAGPMPHAGSAAWGEGCTGLNTNVLASVCFNCSPALLKKVYQWLKGMRAEKQMWWSSGARAPRG